MHFINIYYISLYYIYVYICLVIICVMKIHVLKMTHANPHPHLFAKTTVNPFKFANYSPLLSKRGILKLLMSVRPCVCPSSDLRVGWMDHSETLIWYSLVPRDDARCFRFLKLSKMADWQPFSEIWKMLNNSLNMRVRGLVCIDIK